DSVVNNLKLSIAGTAGTGAVGFAYLNRNSPVKNDKINDENLLFVEEEEIGSPPPSSVSKIKETRLLGYALAGTATGMATIYALYCWSQMTPEERALFQNQAQQIGQQLGRAIAATPSALSDAAY